VNSKQLHADQVQKLYDHAALGLIATLINSCILVLVLWGEAEAKNLLVWLSAVAILCAGRLLLSVGFHQSAPSRRAEQKWRHLFLLSLFLAGLLWGAPAVFLFPASSIGHQIFLAFVTGGMVAGAVGSYTSILSGFYLFSVPALLPVVVRFFLLGGEIHLAMAFMTLVFFLIMSLTALQTHRDYVRLLALRYENRDLVDDLLQEVNQRKQAEQDLRQRNRQIEEIVEARTTELKQAIARLQAEVKTRKEVALALKESEQRMRAVINCAPLVIWAIDREGVVTFSEGKGLEKIDLQPGQLVGQSLFELFADNEEIIHNTRLVLAGKPVSGPTVYNGVVFENRYEPIVDDSGANTGAIGVAIDITSQHQAKEELRKGEKRYRELVENISDVLFTLDQTGRITYVSPVITSLFGYRPADLLHKHFCDLLDPGDRIRFNADLELALSGENKVSEYRLSDASGQLKWCRTGIRPVLDDGGVGGVQGILADVSQARLLEEQLQRAHKMEAIGALAGGVAHDLNNILSGIVSYPDLLLLDLPEDSPLRNPLETIKASGEKAAVIVQDLLTLARRGVAAMELLNANHLVEEYLRSPECRTLLTLHPEVRITKNLQPDLLNLAGSRVHLAKSLMNLVTNGAEAMPSGGTVTIATANRYLDKSLNGFETVAEGEYVVLSVEDTGVGIEKEHLARIFEPFYTRKVMGRSGSGLGMAVVWGTVKDHGGHINVNSIKGVGTRFELYLPASRQSLPETSRPAPLESYQGHGELILVVDDVRQQREIAAGILLRLGYRTDTVASGEEAVDYLEKQTPALVILDMIMDPGIDGFETYRRIVSRHPGQKAIIVSGYSETEHVHRTQELGAGRYLKKPYTLEAIGLAVRQELEASPR